MPLFPASRPHSQHAATLAIKPASKLVRLLPAGLISAIVSILLLTPLTSQAAPSGTSAASVSSASSAISAKQPATQNVSSAANLPSAQAKLFHFLNRTSFGPTLQEVQQVENVGLQTYLENQLHPENIPMTQALKNALASLPSLSAAPSDLMHAAGLDQNQKSLSEEDRKSIRQHAARYIDDLSTAKILRATLSNAQLQEVMVDFWFNHFNINAQKGANAALVADYENKAIRPYVFGKFGDLLKATAMHPAMLIYLDNAANIDPNSRAGRKRNLGINENYAREIMELHTLGVNGGYTQQDVTTLAHILTGWGLARGPNGVDRSVFQFTPALHDSTDKFFLGQAFKGGGVEEIDRALNLLAHHPSTAKHIATKLAQLFITDNPPPSIIKKLALIFTQTDGDISQVLRALFAAPEFWNAQYYQAKFKPPFRYVISCLRLAQITPQVGKGLRYILKQMGQPLYVYPTPNGYSNTRDQWFNSDALLKRINFVNALNKSLGPNAANRWQQVLATGPWSAETITTVNAASPALKGSLLLNSPEFLYY